MNPKQKRYFLNSPIVAELAFNYTNPVIINVNDNAMQGHLCMHTHSIEG